MSELAIDEVKERNAYRCAVTIEGDLAGMADVLSDDLLFAHLSGSVEDKPAYMANSTNGLRRYLAFAEQGEPLYRVYGDTVLVNGRVKSELLIKGERRSVGSCYLAVWHRQNGAWRLVSWQSTPAAERG